MQFIPQIPWTRAELQTAAQNTLRWMLTPSEPVKFHQKTFSKDPKKTWEELKKPSQIFKNILAPSEVVFYAIAGATMGCYTGQPLVMAAAGSLIGMVQEGITLLPDHLKEMAVEIAKVGGMTLGVSALCNLLPNSWFESARAVKAPISKHPDTVFFNTAEAIANFGSSAFTYILAPFVYASTSIQNNLPPLGSFIPLELSALFSFARSLFFVSNVPLGTVSRTVGAGPSIKLITCVLTALAANVFFSQTAKKMFPTATKTLKELSHVLPPIWMLATVFSATQFIQKNKDGLILNASLTAVSTVVLMAGLAVHVASNHFRKEKEPEEQKIDSNKAVQEIYKMAVDTKEKLSNMAGLTFVENRLRQDAELLRVIEGFTDELADQFPRIRGVVNKADGQSLLITVADGETRLRELPDPDLQNSAYKDILTRILQEIPTLIKNREAAQNSIKKYYDNLPKAEQKDKEKTLEDDNKKIQDQLKNLEARQKEIYALLNGWVI